MIAIVAVTALAEALFALPLALAAERRLADQDRRELTQLAALAATRVEGDRLSSQPSKGQPEPEQRLGLYDRAGDRVDGDGPLALEEVVRGSLKDRVVDTRARGLLVIGVPVVANEKVTGVVRASEPLSAGASRVHQTWLRIAMLAVGSLVLAGIAAVLLARRLTRPLEELGRDAARIGEGDFTVQTTATGLPEVDRVGTNLTRTASRLSDILAREQAFTADASHQLRSPLTGLRLTLEAELAHPHEEPATAIELALGDVERLEATIDDLLALARDTATSREAVDLSAELGALRGRWTAAFAAKGSRLLVHETPPGASALVSAAALAHVLDVLVENARDYASGQVEVRARIHDGAVSITIEDDGPGVADPAGIFERRNPDAGGTGIGLALARRLTEAEGGRLRLARAAPGAVFEVTLPLGATS